MKPPKRVTPFIFSCLVIGIAIAAITVWLAPEVLHTERPVVEIHEAPPASRVVTEASVTAPASYAEAVARAAPAVVNIYSAKEVAEPRHPFFDEPMLRRFFGERNAEPRKRLETSLGSGVVVSNKGYVLTNNHVIQGADEIQVLLSDGRNIAAGIVGADPETDLAVLKIALQSLPTVTLGHSHALRVGDVVLAIGNPFGIGQTVTQGIVSATGRNQLGLATFENFIQTDAAINPGNSGGALINTAGEVIGINTAIFSQTGGSLGIGFAIPISIARGVVKSIVEDGRVIRGWIGIQVQGIPTTLATSFGLDTSRGVLIAGVLRGSPAAQAGLHPGDVVLNVNGKPIADTHDLLTIITAQKPGTTIVISGVHSGLTFQREVSIAERPRKL